MRKVQKGETKGKSRAKKNGAPGKVPGKTFKAKKRFGKKNKRKEKQPKKRDKQGLRGKGKEETEWLDIVNTPSEVKKHAQHFEELADSHKAFKEDYEANANLVKHTKVLADKKTVQKVVAAIRALQGKKEVKDVLASHDGDDPVLLQITLFKLPEIIQDAHLKISWKVKVKLPNTLIQDKTDVLLITRDRRHGQRVDYSITENIYTNRLQRKKANELVTEVMPVKQLQMEYNEFEAKRNLSNRVDVVLCDSVVLKRMPRLLGKHFYSKKKFPIDVNVQAKDLKTELTRALRTSHLVFKGGNSATMQVGHLLQTDEQIVQNVLAAVRKVAYRCPGGWLNVQNLSLKLKKSSSVPFFVKLKPLNKVKPIQPKPLYDLTDKEIVTEGITTRPTNQVTVYPDGQIMVTKVDEEDIIKQRMQEGVKRKAEVLKQVKEAAKMRRLEKQKLRSAKKVALAEAKEKEAAAKGETVAEEMETSPSKNTKSAKNTPSKTKKTEESSKKKTPAVKKAADKKKTPAVKKDKKKGKGGEDKTDSLEQAYLKRLRVREVAAEANKPAKVAKGNKEVDAWAEDSDSSDSEVEM